MTNVTAMLMGDPSPERSALNNRAPWAPTYNDGPVVADRKKARGRNYIAVTAEQIEAVIAAASREVGADPALVANGTKGSRANTIAQARAYAAMTIEEVFDPGSRTEIGRMVGASNPQLYLSVVISDYRRNRQRWWDQKIFKRVVAAARQTIEV